MTRSPCPICLTRERAPHSTTCSEDLCRRTYKRRWSQERRDELKWQAPRAKPRTIPCLRCGRPFESEGPHNRICDDCRGVNRKFDPSAAGVSV